MLFTTWQYILFLAIVVFLYYRIHNSNRIYLIFFSSFIFYGSWNPKYLILLCSITFWFYLFAIIINNSTKIRNKKIFLIISISGIIFILLYYKYFNFAVDSINVVAASIGWDATVNKSFIILPLGISFYTFQGISYLIDVYRKSQKPEYNYIYFQSYIAFFPQLVAGPIERAGNILPQLYKKTRFDWNSLGVGITYILWGLFKKMALADNLALLVDKVFSDPQSYTSFELLVAAYSFAFQIYFDFSAYSQIAIGSARLMGINLSKNFNLPYFAINPIDFWRRWHITLSKWLRDYIYIPLGGSRKSNQRTYLNLLFTMLLAGLWHGSNWTFVIWGGYHGILLAINHFIKRFYAEDKKKDNSLITIIKIIVTFNLVCIGWIFFRAKSISDAIYFIQGIIAFSGWYITPTMAPYLVLLIGIISVNILYYFFENKLNAIEYNRKTTAVTIFILIVALAIQANSMGTKFIYFEF